MIVFMIPGWMMNLHVELSVINQSSPVFSTEVDNGEGWSIRLGGALVVTCFAMRYWPWRRLVIVLYWCTGGI